MRINIWSGFNFAIENFKNYDFFNTKDFLKCTFVDVDKIADNGEVEEIIAINTLNYIEHVNIEMCIKNWFKKLKYDGTITLSFFDFLEVCRFLTVGQLTLAEAKKMLYGEQDFYDNFFKSGISLEEIKNIFISLNAKIEICKRDGVFSYIRARRVM